MLLPKTKSLITSIFLTLINGESTIEQKRLLLNTTPNFDPYILFNSLDTSNNNSLTATSFLTFLTNNTSYSLKLNHIKFFIQFYDSNCSHSINYNEFLNIVLCNSFYALKTQSQTSLTNNTSNSHDIYDKYISLLLSELDMITQLDNTLVQLKMNSDFSLYELLKCLGCVGNIIHVNNLYNFIYENNRNVNLNKDDMCKLMKRLDIKRNGIIDMWNLEQLFYSPYVSCGIEMEVDNDNDDDSCIGSCKDKEGTITILVNELDRGGRCYNEGRLIKRKVIMRNKGRCGSFGGCNGCNKKKECLCLSSVESNNYNNTITNVNKQIQRYVKHKIKDNVCVKHNNTECNRDYKQLRVSKSFYKNNIRTCSNDKNDNDLQCTNVVALVNNTNKQSLTNLFKLNHNSTNSKTKFKKLQINTNPNYAHFRKYNNNFPTNTQLFQQHKSTITTETKIHNKNIPTYFPKTNYQSQLQLQPRQPILFPNTTPTTTQETFTEEILIIFLTILLDIETLIEKKKIIQLFPLNDFNIEGIFSLFEHSSTNDENSDNVLSTSDFKNGLIKVFGFPVIDKYINLLLAKYDLDEVEGLTFSNFFDMLVPFERVHRVNIDKRKTVYDISYKTLLNIKDFLLFIIETEQKIERFRNKVQQMKGCEEIIKKIFKNEIDTNKKGRITNTQLNKYLKCKIKEFKHKYKHSHLLFIRLDRNRDGYVTVNDILNELIPHS